MAKLAEALPKMTGALEILPWLHMDKMLAEAEINPANMKRLSDNFQQIRYYSRKNGDIADMHAATADYT